MDGKSEQRLQLEHIFATYDFIADDLSDFLDKIEEIYHPKVKSLEERKQAFIEELRPYLEVYPKEMINDFGKWWLQISPKGRKYKFETEKSFQMSLRLSTWSKRSKQYSIVNMLNKVNKG